MKRFLKDIALTLFVLALTATAAAAQSALPKLDLSTTCRPLGNNDFSIQIDTDRCLRSEGEARAKLSDEWATYPAADRNICTQTARMGGIESYVQLLTCLELRHAARTERSKTDPRFDLSGGAAPLMQERPAGLPRSR
jgi:hypothetical protein